MNQPPSSGMNTPQGYGPPPAHGQPPSAPLPASGSYHPQHPQRTGFTRQIFNPAMYKQPGSGSWAAASLILAIIGWVTLGCLGIFTWPLGLLFGLIGMVGNKRAKGLSFAGFILSAAGIGLGVLLLSIGFFAQFQTEKMAENAGKPVVAAIAEFKQDNKRVPYSLEELVAEGYLPPRWDQGFAGIDGNVEEFVKGRKWSDFLAYRPGADGDWVGRPGEGGGVQVEGDWTNWSISFDDGQEREHQTYGLSFIGLDGQWGGSDDAAVRQELDESFDLTQLWGGDSKTREFGQKRRELQRMLTQLEDKRESLEGAVAKARGDLDQVEDELRQLMRERNLADIEAVRADTKGAGLLKLAGATDKRLQAARRKLVLVTDKVDTLGIQVRLLANEEEMAKIADNPEEMAELITLLEDSRKVLDDQVPLSDLDRIDDDKAADNWFKTKFK
jgi:hypothetical protein